MGGVGYAGNSGGVVYVPIHNLPHIPRNEYHQMGGGRLGGVVYA